MSLRKRLSQLRALNSSDWYFLLLSMGLLPLIGFMLRFKGFKWTRNWLSRHADVHTTIPEDQQQYVAENIARMVSIAAHHGLYRTNCLKIALATWWLLQRRGIETALKIGVNKEGDTFNAHAWLEYQTQALMEPDDVRSRFRVMNDSTDSCWPSAKR